MTERIKEIPEPPAKVRSFVERMRKSHGFDVYVTAANESGLPHQFHIQAVKTEEGHFENGYYISFNLNGSVMRGRALPGDEKLFPEAWKKFVDEQPT